MSKNKLSLLIVMLITSCQCLLAQTRQVNGIVTDTNGDPLAGATVQVEGTSTGTATNADGAFSIQAEPSDILVFSFVGMKTVKVNASSSVVNAVLELDSYAFEEVVVVAYGTQREEALTGAVNTIKAEEFSSRPFTNVSNALEGSSPGLQMSSATGQPGASDQSVRIRGFSSVTQNSEPLYVVDGIPGVSLNTINMMDVETITVLKDASATALYGSRATNGVILITTKTGKKGKKSFTVNANTGFVQRGIQEYERVGVNEYYPIQWESIRNSLIYSANPIQTIEEANQNATNQVFGTLEYNPFNVPNNQIVGTDGLLNPNAEVIARDLDWRDAIERTGLRQQFDISYVEGFDQSDLYTSFGYLKEEGYVSNSFLERFSARTNMNFSPKSWFKSGFNLSGSLTDSNFASAQSSNNNSINNPIRAGRFFGPIYPVYKLDENGNYQLSSTGERIFSDDNRGPGASSGRNAVAENLWNKDGDRIMNISGRTYGTISFLKDFSFTTNVGLDYRNINNTSYDNPLIGDGAPGGRAGRTITNSSRFNINNLLTYEKEIKEINLTALVGHEYYHRNLTVVDGFKNGQVADDNNNLSNFVNISRLIGYEDNHKINSYLSRLNLDYQDKYFFSTSARLDYSSKFSPQERDGFFWSIGSGWVISKEDFLSDNNTIDFLKLRASMGTTGNDGSEFYGWQGLYDLNFNADEPGATISTIPPPFGYTWETNFQKDIAIEFALLNRINGTIEYYNRKTEDLIFEVPAPVSSGIPEYLQNIGDMYNRGFELDLGVEVMKKANLSWNVNMNATTVKNEITRMPDGNPIINGTKRWAEGQSRYEFWMRSWYGVNPDNGDALYNADDVTSSDVFELNGEMVTTNQNNARFEYQGTSIPDVYGGLRNNVNYKNFSLDFLLAYSIGGKVFDRHYRDLMHTGNSGGRAWHKDILNRWQEPGDITDVPRLDVLQEPSFTATSSRFLVDASYMSIRNVTLGYDLPSSLTDKIGVSNFRGFMSGENLGLFSERQGLDPQQGFAGTVANIYPVASVYSLGLNVSF